MKTNRNGYTVHLLILNMLLVLFSQVFAQDVLYQKIDDIVQAEANYDLFSGTILVAKEGKTIYAKEFGEVNMQQHISNVPDTRFNISSIQKPFIATLIMQLHQDGLLDIDDPLSKYFPDCPFKTANQIKIKNLLNNTSGLGDYRSHKRYQEESENYKEITDVLPLVYEQDPKFAPGEKFEYSNTGYLFLKAIIEKVEKKKLADVFKQRLFDPLGMESTILFQGGDLISNRANGHILSAESNQYVNAIGEPAAYDGGGIYSSTMDLLKFDQALYTEKLLTEENKKIMFTPIEPSKYYAYGWIVVPFGGTTVIYHNGGSGGFSSEFRRYPEKRITIVVLSNYDNGAFMLANKIDCMLLDQPYLVTTEAEAHCRRARIYRMENEFEAALKLYIAAIKLYENGAVEKNIAQEIQNGINSTAYAYINQNDLVKAIEIFQINTDHFPESANAYDSLAEAYMKSEQKDLAIKNYEKSLELDSENANAKAMLLKLKK